MIGGGLLLAVGLFVLFHAWSNYDLGTLRRMGPGLFPAALGALLGLTGLAITVTGFLAEGLPPAVDWKPLILVVVAVVVFALTVKTLGLAPAIVLMTIPAAMADGRLGLLGTLLLALALAVISVLLFVVAFNMQIPVARWPF
jgi:Tripartite tricarboxylate transporter TctB family.